MPITLRPLSSPLHESWRPLAWDFHCSVVVCQRSAERGPAPLPDAPRRQQLNLSLQFDRVVLWEKDGVAKNGGILLANPQRESEHTWRGLFTAIDYGNYYCSIK